MGERSKIEWTDHTFNPWVGCTKISPGCDHCYAESWAKRTGGAELWNGQRRRTTAANWRKPLKWNVEARELGIRYRVFCASLADVFDNGVDAQWRYDLWDLIANTPNLDWLLLTKRIGNASAKFPASMSCLPNVWLGVTVVNQHEADRDIPKLLATPAMVRFLSIEPMLGPIDLKLAYPSGMMKTEAGTWLDWVIVGGESGANARPFTLGYAKELVAQCRAAGVPVFVKQLGARPVNREGERCPHITHPKGAVMAEWPEVLRVRESPRVNP